MIWLLVMLLWTAMLFTPFVLLYLFLPAGTGCARCLSETIRIQSTFLRPLRGLLSSRWCPGCGWEGVARTVVLRRPLPRFEVVPDDHDDADEKPWLR